MVILLGEKSTAARDKFSVNTNLAVSSTEFCQCLFDERNIREGLSGGCGHKGMIPLLLNADPGKRTVRRSC
jgi:hypothetical protein